MHNCAMQLLCALLLGSVIGFLIRGVLLRKRTRSSAPQSAFITGGEWKEKVVPTHDQSLWLDLLDEDVISAEISFHEYAGIAPVLNKLTGNQLAQANGKAMHFAKSFVSAARRVWWVLETCDLKMFPEPVAQTIKLERRKKKAFFAAYIEPRNAVEHASAEVKEVDKHVVRDMIFLQPEKGTWHPVIARLDLRRSSLTLASGESAAVNTSALGKILDCHSTIIASVLQHLPPRGKKLLLLGPLDTSDWDT